MHARRASTHASARSKDCFEEARALGYDNRNDGDHAKKRNKKSGLSEQAVVRNREYKKSCRETEEAASRQGRELDDEQESQQRSEGRPQPVAPLKPQVDRKKHQQWNDEHDPKVVRIEHERVGPKDILSIHRPEHVDSTANGARDRLEHDLVEVSPTGLCIAELEQAVYGVNRDPAHEPAERTPVVILRTSRKMGDASDQEGKVDYELDHPLRELISVGDGLDIEEADEIDDGEGSGRRARESRTSEGSSNHAVRSARSQRQQRTRSR